MVYITAFWVAVGGFLLLPSKHEEFTPVSYLGMGLIIAAALVALVAGFLDRHCESEENDEDEESEDREGKWVA